MLLMLYPKVETKLYNKKIVHLQMICIIKNKNQIILFLYLCFYKKNPKVKCINGYQELSMYS